MKECMDQGILQALIDGELELETRKKAESHVAICSECSTRLANLRDNDDFTFSKIRNYQGWIEARTGRTVKNGAPGRMIVRKTFKVKEVFEMIRKYQSIAVVAGVLIAIAVCVTVQPVRAALTKALLVLRVEDVKSIKLSLQDIEAIRKQVESKAPAINVAQFGKIRMKGGEQENINIAEARQIEEFKVAFPQTLNYATPNIDTVSAVSFDLVLKTANINRVLQSLGNQTALPDSLDGQVFHIDFSRVVNLEYKLSADRHLKITQLRSPEITAPADVNVDELYNALVDLPIFPVNLRNQLRGIKDWKNTLYIPVVDNQMTEITVNGHKGFIGTVKQSRSKTQNTMVIWLDHGVIYTLDGNIDKGEALNIAGSME